MKKQKKKIYQPKATKKRNKKYQSISFNDLNKMVMKAQIEQLESSIFEMFKEATGNDFSK